MPKVAADGEVYDYVIHVRWPRWDQVKDPEDHVLVPGLVPNKGQRAHGHELSLGDNNALDGAFRVPT